MKETRNHQGRIAGWGWRVVILGVVIRGLLAAVGSDAAPLNTLLGGLGYPQYSTYVWDENSGVYLTNSGSLYTGTGSHPENQPGQLANLWNTNTVVQAFGNTIVEQANPYGWGREWDGSGLLGNFSQYGRARTNFNRAGGIAVDFTGDGYTREAQLQSFWLSSSLSPSGNPGPSIFGIDAATDTMLQEFNASFIYLNGGTLYTNNAVSQLAMDPYSHDIYAVYGNDLDPRCNCYFAGGIVKWSTNGVMLASHVYNWSSYSVALNPVNDHILLYVNNYSQRIEEYDSNLNYLNGFQIFNENNQFRYGAQLTLDMDGRLFVSATDNTFTNARIYEYYTTNATFSSSDLRVSFWGAPIGTSAGDLAINWQIPEPTSAALVAGVVLLGCACRRRARL